MSELTLTERKWLKKLQMVMDECPSPERIGFYTIGDPEVALYDRAAQAEIDARQDRGDDFCTACQYTDANFSEFIRFPSHVHSTAG